MSSKLKWKRQKVYSSIRATGANRTFLICGFTNGSKVFFNLLVNSEMNRIPYGNLSVAVEAANRLNDADLMLSGDSIDDILDTFISDQK